jgi:hypothetical protein
MLTFVHIPHTMKKLMPINRLLGIQKREGISMANIKNNI